MDGMKVDRIIVNIQDGSIKREKFKERVNIGGNEVEKKDIRRVMDDGEKKEMDEESKIVNQIKVGYKIEGESGISEKIGMMGERIGVDMNVMKDDEEKIRNMEI